MPHLCWEVYVHAQQLWGARLPTKALREEERTKWALLQRTAPHCFWLWFRYFSVQDSSHRKQCFMRRRPALQQRLVCFNHAGCSTHFPQAFSKSHRHAHTHPHPHIHSRLWSCNFLPKRAVYQHIDMDKVNATGHVPTKKCVQFLATTLLGLSLCSVTFAQVVKPVYVSYYYVPFEKRPSVI